MNAIGALVSIDVSHGRADEMSALLERMARVARADAGTEVWDVCRDVNQTGRFWLYERYRDRDAFRLHRSNAELAELGVRLGELADNLTITRLDVAENTGDTANTENTEDAAEAVGAPRAASS